MCGGGSCAQPDLAFLPATYLAWFVPGSAAPPHTSLDPLKIFGSVEFVKGAAQVLKAAPPHTSLDPLKIFRSVEFVKAAPPHSCTPLFQGGGGGEAVGGRGGPGGGPQGPRGRGAGPGQGAGRRAGRQGGGRRGRRREARVGAGQGTRGPSGGGAWRVGVLAWGGAVGCGRKWRAPTRAHFRKKGAYKSTLQSGGRGGGSRGDLSSRLCPASPRLSARHIPCPRLTFGDFLSGRRARNTAARAPWRGPLLRRRMAP